MSQPFFGALALRLAVREDPSAKTFWVDGETMGFNPAYLDSLSDLEVRGVVAHEVLHVANGHCWRQGARDPDRWNDACDYAINPIVVSAGMVLPKGRVDRPRYTGKSAEEIYGLLTQEAKQKQQQQPQPSNRNPASNHSTAAGSARAASSRVGRSTVAVKRDQGRQQAPQSGPQPSQNPGSFGEVRPYKGPDQPVKEAEWKVAVTQAAKAAAMRGKLPGDLQAMAGEAVRPVVDWRAVLHRFAQQSSPSDYSFAMPNRRYLHLGFYCPRCTRRQSAMQSSCVIPAGRCSTRRRHNSMRKSSSVFPFVETGASGRDGLRYARDAGADFRAR